MKAKFNAIDFIIILVIAAIIAVGSYYLVSTMGGGTSGKSAGGEVLGGLPTPRCPAEIVQTRKNI